MLAPCYLIHGGEPLQTEEYIAGIRNIAAKEGYNTSMVFEINTQFDWGELLNKCQSMDLFTEKSLIELRLHSENIGKSGTQELEKLLQNQHSDICILIRAPKLKPQILNSNWVSQIQKKGKIELAKPISTGQWQGWVRQRLQKAGFSASSTTINSIANCYEGSLTAAAQCIDRIKTTCPPGQLELDQIKPLLENNAKFSVFELTDAAVSGSAARTLNIFQSLKVEGLDPVLMLWGVTREIRTLLSLSYEMQKGASLAQSAQNLGIWRDKLPSIKGALDRLSTRKLQNLLKSCKTIDTMLKGITPGSAWEPLLSVYLALASSTTLTTEDLYI